MGAKDKHDEVSERELKVKEERIRARGVGGGGGGDGKCAINWDLAVITFDPLSTVNEAIHQRTTTTTTTTKRQLIDCQSAK